MNRSLLLALLAFGVKPGQKLYLAPEKRVKIW
jgi:predicted metalloendopeptidase